MLNMRKKAVPYAQLDNKQMQEALANELATGKKAFPMHTFLTSQRNPLPLGGGKVFTYYGTLLELGSVI